MASLAVYKGPFGPAQAERLLWRAGFGPRGGEEYALAKKGLQRAVDSLVQPHGIDRLVGKPPSVDGHGIAPKDAFGHDHLWWLDRMVRTSQPLVERMTLVWHDWFATSNETVGNQRIMLQQNDLFREIGLGSFEGLAMRVTINPAMLLYLNGLNSVKGAPNENYARELMELFTLGVDNGYIGARRPRAGARADRLDRRLPERLRLDALPLQAREPRRRHEGGLREDRRPQLEGRGQALHRPPEARRPTS